MERGFDACIRDQKCVNKPAKLLVEIGDEASHDQCTQAKMRAEQLSEQILTVVGRREQLPRARTRENSHGKSSYNKCMRDEKA